MDILGKTIISDDVFVELARTSIQNVNEVFRQERKGPWAELTHLFAERFIPQIIVRKSETEVPEGSLGKISYELKLTLQYGINIPEAVKKVRETVASEVEALSGYKVDRIDVLVEKLVKPERIERLVEVVKE